jgi:flagellar biosynthesis/type III secretory pathway protein FliH
MPKVVFKIPKKLHRVEIIRAKDAVVDSTPAFLPITEFPLEAKPQSVFEEEVVDILNEQFEERHEESLKPIKQLFVRSSYFIEQDKPISISLDKVPDETMTLDEVRKEVQAAYQKGFVEGQEITSNTLQRDIAKQQSWIRNIDKVIADIQKHYAREIQAVENSVVKLSVMVAQHILNNEISHNSDVVIDQVKKSIKAVENDTIFKIYIHPDNIKILENVKSDLVNGTDKLDKVKIIADNSQDKGSCVLESSGGIVDARITTQLEKISEKLSEIPTTEIIEDMKA